MGIVNYIKESFKELNNEVTWISLNEAQKSTILVVVFTIVFSLAVFVTDKFFQTILDAFLSYIK
ncbi:MAG: preprotein translocase subunit SecE [Flavobacteriaceae bacterium]|nr:preprotein translocase subunit SecE [Flavobacteriaceae bacterium]